MNQTKLDALELQPAFYRLAALTYTRFEGDVIEEFVRHTLRFVDRLYIVDNLSPDGTRAILAALVDEGLPITIWTSDILESRMDVMTHFARRVFASDAADYLLILDADEFVRAPSRAAYELALRVLAPGAHATVPWVNYIPTIDDVEAPGVLGSIRYRLAEETIQFSKIVVSRSFVLQPKAEITAGFHGLEDAAGNAIVVPLPGISIAHFPVRSIAQLQGKALLGWSSFLIMEDHNDHMLGYQWRRLYEELQRNPEWTREDLCYFARTYLDPNQTAPALIFDPMPTSECHYQRPVPGLVELALAYTKSLTDYCLCLKLEHAADLRRAQIGLSAKV